MLQKQINCDETEERKNLTFQENDFAAHMKKGWKFEWSIFFFFFFYPRAIISRDGLETLLLVRLAMQM